MAPLIFVEITGLVSDVNGLLHSMFEPIIIIFLVQHTPNVTPLKSTSVTEQTIMKSILLSKGPITTQQILRSNFRKLRHVTKDEFVEASRKLEGFSLGSFVQVANPTPRPIGVFVKKPPEQVVHILQIMPGLCTLEEYSERFAMRVPTLISLRMRTQLVTLGLVSEKQLK